MDIKERSSNFELLRIISMFMIVLSHCTWYGVLKVGHADAYVVWNTGSIIYKLFSSTSILGTIGVGLFFMISGFFTVKKSKTKILKVCLTTVFYSIMMVLVMLISRIIGIKAYESDSDLIFDFLKMLFVPISGSVWWYVTAYIFLMLIAPIYNEFINKLNRKGFVLLLFVLLIFGYTLGNLGSNFHDIEKALYFYTLGAYFKLFIPKYRNSNIFVYVLLGVIGIILNGLCQYFVFKYTVQSGSLAVLFRKSFSMAGYLIADSLACFGIFGFFSKLSFSNKVVNKIASYSFGVYLFHESPVMRQLLWFNFLKPWRFYGNALYFIMVPCFCVMVFFAGVVCDFIRDKLIFNQVFAVVERLKNRFKGAFFL